MSVIERKLDESTEKFWKAVEIFHNFPQTVNKQCAGSVTVLKVKCSSEASQCIFCKLNTFHGNSCVSREQLIESCLSDCLGKYEVVDDAVNIFEETAGLFITFRRILPKVGFSESSVHYFYELAMIDKSQLTITFSPVGNRYLFKNTKLEKSSKMLKLETPTVRLVILKYQYLRLTFSNQMLRLYMSESCEVKERVWLEILFEKICKNMKREAPTNEPFRRLACSEEYNDLYNQMKEKYATKLIDNWTETTDPIRKVYEDIGVASYLLLLWKKETRSQRFIDLGCGNGFLVHLLNSEGHSGIGYDVKKRKIWDTYPETTVLEIKEIIPSTDTVYKDADWLIGNHSDELTAWIPIMAARSNKSCRYFVLPCCPYELNGTKFQRRNSGVSCYADFLIYVQKISNICGYLCFIDKLKVVSTKKICIVGENRKEIVDEDITKFIDEEFQLTRKLGRNLPPYTDHWISEFKVRDAVEKVRNCTRIPQSVINDILLDISKLLLQNENIIEIKKQHQVVSWNAGQQISISTIAKALLPEKLKFLKQECKGLQTLLRNNHYIFEVKDGCVGFRRVESMKKESFNILNSDKKLKWKEKNCWFYFNHPQGCPLEDQICSYKHS